MLEYYKKIPEYPNYAISNIGNVKNMKTGRILKSWYVRTGYKQIRIIENKKQKKEYVHRLVGLAFLINDNKLYEIDHIDRNKNNNTVGNLRWVTHKENCLNKNEYTQANKNNLCGELYIQYRQKNNIYCIIKKGKYYGSFKTLNDAVECRNNLNLI